MQTPTIADAARQIAARTLSPSAAAVLFLPGFMHENASIMLAAHRYAMPATTPPPANISG